MSTQEVFKVPIKKELSREDREMLRNVAQNIIFLMEEHDLSIRKLAREIDESRSTVHNYLSCRNPATIPFLNKVAKRFNKSIDWLVTKHRIGR